MKKNIPLALQIMYMYSNKIISISFKFLHVKFSVTTLYVSILQSLQFK